MENEKTSQNCATQKGDSVGGLGTNKTLLIAWVGSILAITALAIGGMSYAGNSDNAWRAIQNGSGMQAGFGSGNAGMMRGEGRQGKWMWKERWEMKWVGIWLGMGGNLGRGDMMWFGKQNTGVQAALAANDYNAFLKEWNADNHKPENATAPTQDQFTRMVEVYKKREAAQSAIEANDYDAYVKANTITKEEFADIVTQHKNRTAIENAVEKNDYNAFVSAWNAQTHNRANATVPTKEQFAQMVTRHQEMNTTTEK